MTTFLERQRDAALAEIREIYAERRRVETIVIGDDHRTRRGRSVGEIVRLGSDCLVEVQERDKPATWTVVRDNQRDSWHWRTQEDAVLYLIAIRHGGDPTAVYYAGRVLGIPQTDH